MGDDDFLLTDDDNLDEDSYYVNLAEEDPDEEDSAEEVEEPVVKDDSIYNGKLTETEIKLSSWYDSMLRQVKEKDESIAPVIQNTAMTIIMANPKHTSSLMRNNILRKVFDIQGKARRPNSVYVPSGPISGEDVSLEFEDDDSGFNKMYMDEAREQITRFIGFLANRDLSKDSKQSKIKKQRHIPAFIIFLFSSGMYGLIVNCPTMPKVYDDQIKRALEKIIKSKYDIVEDLAEEYEKAGRPKVADRVRKMRLSWFDREPATIKTLKMFEDLELTQDDVIIYKKYRSKYTNISKSITQEVISDYIEVVSDEKAYITYKLKDKTRGDAIEDVKEVYKQWAKDNPIESDLAKKVIWKDPSITNE